MADNNDQDKKIDSEKLASKNIPASNTVLSITELEKLQTQHNMASAKSEDPDATILMQPHVTINNASPVDATVLSATEVENLKTQHIDDDPDATQILDPHDSPDQVDDDATVVLEGRTKATVLAGGTEAVHEAITTSFSPRVAVGSTIKDRFTLEKILGRGGMGEVYLATDKRKIEAQDKNPYVALKVLNENFKRHPQAFIALQREARKTQELAHPNIITVYDFDRQGDTVYITMEALTGKPMDEEIRKEGDVRSLAEAVNIITQCANGLAYAHKKNLVHSDLKPGNLFLTEDGTAKLLDFGIARAFNTGKDLEQKKDAKDDTVFDAGDLGALTPAYASYEMITGSVPHPSDDVYALGLIAYELLTGKHPFDKTMATTAFEQDLSPEKVKGLSKQQWYAIEKALAFKREDRIQNAQEFFDLFTAKSKTPLYIASILIVIAFLTVGSLSYYLKTPEIGPEVPFAELSIDMQNQVTHNLDEASIALKFNDYNGALQYLDTAFNLHPYNPDVMAKIDLVISKLLIALAAYEKPEQAKQIKAMLEYPALSNNKQLIEYQKKL